MKNFASGSLFSVLLTTVLFSQNFTSQVNIEYVAPTIHFKDNTNGHDNYWIRADTDRLYFLWDQGDDGDWDAPHPLYFHGRNSYFDQDSLFVNGDLDRVGIGTTNPSRPLQVTGPAGYVVRVDIESNSVGHDSLIEFSGRDSNNSSQRYGAIGTEIRSNSNGAENGDLLFHTASSSDNGQTNEKMRLTSSGNLGIGNTTPQRKLHVTSTGAYILRLDRNVNTNGADIHLEFTGNDSTGSDQSYGRLTFEMEDTTAGSEKSNIRFVTADNGNLPEKMRIQYNGNVGIGTTSPNHKLDVNGTIRAKEVIVETGWSDYVFEEDYILAPLSEVEAHIEEKGHLPGIPSAVEIEANGAKLSELVTLQMAKIEELTLHLINQQKEIDAIKVENVSLRKLIQTN